MNQTEKRIYLIRSLLDENEDYRNAEIPSDSGEQRSLLRGLMNIRIPKNISDDFLKIQDEYLKSEIENSGITDIDSLSPIENGIYLWQGDITRLRCDAIVNAANSGMTGCYVPNHKCIDNCIHTFAGIQLRLKCAEIMNQQGYEEPTGKAKITSAYNLPCKYVIHTVGPIINGSVSERDRELLNSCYNSCFDIAEENKLESIAFCCISTGVFCFPNNLAAEIAVHAVREFLKSSKYIKRVVFNVYKDIDREIYGELLG